MLNYIWAGLMLISVIFAALTGRMNQLTNAVLQGSQEGVTLTLALLGSMCLWSGIMKIADKGGLTAFLSKLFSPILKRLFGKDAGDAEAMKWITMNVTANILGLGNAATPLGLNAMKRLQQNNLQKDRATNAMIVFVVLNTASIQLIPTTVAVLRQKHGCSSPMAIMPALWCATITALLVGLIVAKALNRRSLQKEKGRNEKTTKHNKRGGKQ